MPADRLTRSDAARPGVGIVHLGLGAFFRGFGAVYVADAMAASGGDWGIVGVSLKGPATRDALAPQDFAYQVVSMRPEGETPRVIEVLEDVRVAPEDPEGLLALMADPAIRIVSLTVTEKGYCHEPSTGRLMFDHPDIVHDLTAPLPVSAPGFLVRALDRRRLAGVPPFTVLICDNLPENGKMLRGVVLDLARRIDPALADWIAAECRFPSTMVDRITPATTTADIDRLAKATGHFDAAPVFCEPFRQWVVEDDFVGGIRPDLAAAGVEMVPDVTPFEHMKLKMLNGTHSALAYLGYLGGHETISDTVADPVFAGYVRGLWADEIAPAVDVPEGVSLTDYATALFDRYANPAIRHRTWQIAMDGSQKLPQRILGTLEANFAAGRPSPSLCLAVAAWMRYVGGVDEAGQPIEVKDPMVVELRRVCDATPTPQARVKALLGLPQIFPEAIASKLEGPVTTAATLLWQVGARKAAAQMTETST